MATSRQPINLLLQEMFDKAYDHLLEQGERSLLEINSCHRCAYRGADDCRCAVGVFIPDDRYYPELETKTLHDEEVLAAIPELDGQPPEDACLIRELLQKLQWVHDACPPVAWRRELHSVAACLQLGVPERVDD